MINKKIKFFHSTSLRDQIDYIAVTIASQRFYTASINPVKSLGSEGEI
jgi:hypothetical protein